jgi:hypothetical protein
MVCCEAFGTTSKEALRFVPAALLCSAQPSPAGNAWIPRTSKFHGLGRPLEFTWKFVDREPNTFVLAHPTQFHGWTGPNTSGSIKINVDRWSARTNPVVCTSSSAVLSSGSRRSPWPAPSAAPTTATSSRTSCFIAGLLLDRLGVAPCVCPADSLGAGSCGRARPGSGCRRLRCRRQGSSRGRRRGRGCLRNLCLAGLEVRWVPGRREAVRLLARVGQQRRRHLPTVPRPGDAHAWDGPCGVGAI